MKAGWIVGGWLVAMTAATLPVVWSAADLFHRNPLGLYADPQSGLPTLRLYWRAFQWWLSIATPVSLLAFACMFLNRPRDPR